MSKGGRILDHSATKWIPQEYRRKSSDDLALQFNRSNNLEPPTTDVSTDTTSRRLGFFGHSTKSAHAPSQVQSHARSESTSAAMSSSANLLTTSPQKPSYIRTYDSKLVSRLGTLAHIPASIAPTISAVPSTSSLALPAQGTMSTVNLASSSANSDPWGVLHVHLLPLFNGEPLNCVIENLNVLVRRHIHATISTAPQKALSKLAHDAAELIGAGMVTLNAKLMEIDDEKLVGRVVEIWGFFWDQVLTYVEAVLLPLQTDDLISSLSRTKGHQRATSPNAKGSMSNPSLLPGGAPPIDVRTLALQSFRDRVILPLAPRLYSRLAAREAEETATYPQSRLQQMLLVLASQSRRRPPVLSLTAPAPQPTAGEAAVSNLLKIVRSPRLSSQAFRGQGSKILPNRLVHAPTFVSGGLPRDRRGRIAQKSKGKTLKRQGTLGDGEETTEDDDVFGGNGDETPRNGFGSSFVDVDREREREFLEALRSPDIRTHHAGRASIGGWGLGGGGHKDMEKPEEDEDLDWDQTQEIVERMVGMKHSIDSDPPTPRRRQT